MFKSKLPLLTSFIIPVIILSSCLTGQGLPVDDFSLPICGNANGENDTLYFHNDYFDTTGCNQRIILAAIFTSWWPGCVSGAPITQEIYDTYKDQGLELIGFGADWGQPYTCDDWVNQFGLTYPIADFETGASSWMVEDLPTYFWMNNYFGLWIPSYFVINQNIEIIGGGSGSLTSEGFFAEITSSIEEALDGLGDIDIGDDDNDGIDNSCDPCSFSNYYSLGNLNGSLICPPGCESDDDLVPTFDIYDILLLSDVLENESYETNECFYEAGDIIADGVISLIDILAFAAQVAEGTW